MIRPRGFPDLPPEFEYETEVLQSTDGEHGIFFNWFKKKDVLPKRALLIIHGQGDHGARYQHFAHFLKDQYDLILAPDLRGHGRSEGIRGHVESFDEYVDDALLAWDTLQSRLPKLSNLDWFGHSMGGAVSLRALHYRSDLGIKNLILSAPCLDFKVHVPLPKEIAARLLARVWGSITMDTGLDTGKLSHDPAVTEASKSDQLKHRLATPKFYLSFVSALESLREKDLRIDNRTRVLFQVAGEDEIVSTPAAERFFEHQLQAEHKRIISYPGLYHEIYMEQTKEHLFQDWINWMNET